MTTSFLSPNFFVASIRCATLPAVGILKFVMNLKLDTTPATPRRAATHLLDTIVQGRSNPVNLLLSSQMLLRFPEVSWNDIFRSDFNLKCVGKYLKFRHE